MFLIDLNQITLSNLLAGLQGHTNVTIEEGMIRHMILNSLRYHRQKFFREYGEPILCCDNSNYWRKKLFPHYKANRKKYQEQSELNWNDIFTFLNKVKWELKTFFPYQVIDVESAEADDIIGTLVHKYGVIYPTKPHEEILILSGDKDYIQLQSYNNVVQYDPIRRKWIGHDEPDVYLFEHIVKGDSGDGIPNILSSDDCFVKGVRQKSITKKRLETFHDDFQNGSGALADTHWSRNEQLINLAKVPAEIKEKVMIQYHINPQGSRHLLIPYFMDHKLRNLLEHLSEFWNINRRWFWRNRNCFENDFIFH